jgi:hypothetical protein
VLRHEKVLQNRQPGEQADVLEGAGYLRDFGDLEVPKPLEKIGLAVLLLQGDHAHGRLIEAGDAVEDGGLARPVGADQGGDFAPAGLEREVVDGHQAAEAHRQVLDLEDRVVVHAVRSEGHQPWPSLVKLPETALRSLRKAVG